MKQYLLIKQGNIHNVVEKEAFELARTGGVTCVSTGPGSSNVIGGIFCVIKTYGKH